MCNFRVFLKMLITQINLLEELLLDVRGYLRKKFMYRPLHVRAAMNPHVRTKVV